VIYFADQLADAHADAPVGAADHGTPAGGEAQRRLGCVAVLPGPGLRAVAEQLAAVVVEGASGALPSVADLLNAIGDVRAERIVILPGHRNAVPTARQASEVSLAEGGRTLDVVAEADTPTAVLAALAVCDTGGDPDAVLSDMAEAAAAVRPGEVVPAVRDASTPVGDVREGQMLAVVDGDVIAVADDPLDALRAVAERCHVGGCEVVTLVAGADVDGDELAAAEAVVRSVVAEVEIDVVRGGQRPARYLLGLE
jgi:dihydroxyacetone kinase-like predicted kinase